MCNEWKSNAWWTIISNTPSWSETTCFGGASGLMAGEQLLRDAIRLFWLMIWTILMCFHRLLEWLVKSVERWAFRTLDEGLVKTERRPPSRLPLKESGTTSTVVPESERQEELGEFRSNRYYAVRVGVKPGIYSTWGECEPMVRGFKGAVHKSFRTRSEAERFMRNQG